MDWTPFALILVDVQHDFWTERRQAAHPDFPARVEKLLASARERRIHIVHVRGAFEADGSDWMPRHRLLGEVPCVRGTAGIEPLPCARERPGEPVFFKQSFGGFALPKLEPHLRERGVRFVLVAGLVTSVCVLSTAIGAAERGFLTAVVEDCCADDRPNEKTLELYPFALDRVNHDALDARHAGWVTELKTARL